MALDWQPAHCAPDESRTATNLVRRPVNGCVITSSGRAIPQPPWILPDDPQSQIDYDLWLLEQSRAEAAELDDALILARLDGFAATGLLDADARQLLSDFLFGLSEPEFEAREVPGDLKPDVAGLANQPDQFVLGASPEPD